MPLFVPPTQFGIHGQQPRINGVGLHRPLRFEVHHRCLDVCEDFRGRQFTQLVEATVLETLEGAHVPGTEFTFEEQNVQSSSGIAGPGSVCCV